MEEKPTMEEIIQRYAEVQGITYDAAKQEVDAPTEEEILKNIENKTLEKIRSQMPPLNRAQRRALAKKQKKNKTKIEKSATVETVADTAKKLNYIKLIEELRKLNEKKENEENVEDVIETD